jgi:two-component system chemotaxis response regulator CheB
VNCPIVIVQHMPPIFTATFAERLARISGIPAGEASHGARLERNHIYVAPGDFHVRLQGTGDAITMQLDQGALINSVRPAVDPLFSSAADLYGDQCLGIVLTGMGADGKVGAECIKKRGGAVVIQDEASCVVFGMPGAVHAAGAYDRMTDPGGIVEILREQVGVDAGAGRKRA